MSEIDLTSLKLKIENLMHNRTQLIKENRQLRTKLAKAIQEKASLTHKRDLVCKQLRNYLAQIKEELS